MLATISSSFAVIFQDLSIAFQKKTKDNTTVFDLLKDKPSQEIAQALQMTGFDFKSIPEKKPSAGSATLLVFALTNQRLATDDIIALIEKKLDKKQQAAVLSAGVTYTPLFVGQGSMLLQRKKIMEIVKNMGDPDLQYQVLMAKSGSPLRVAISNSGKILDDAFYLLIDVLKNLKEEQLLNVLMKSDGYYPLNFLIDKIAGKEGLVSKVKKNPVALLVGKSDPRKELLNKILQWKNEDNKTKFLSSGILFHAAEMGDTVALPLILKIIESLSSENQVIAWTQKTLPHYSSILNFFKKITDTQILLDLVSTFSKLSNDNKLKVLLSKDERNDILYNTIKQTALSKALLGSLSVKTQQELLDKLKLIEAQKDIANLSHSLHIIHRDLTKYDN